MPYKHSFAALCFTLLVLVSCTKDEVATPAPVTPPPTTPTTPQPPTTPPPTQSLPDNDHLLLGNPTNAVNDAGAAENYLLDQTYFKEAYSRSRGIPVWVSWHFQSEDVGSTSRQDNFRADTKLPSGWYQVDDGSYSGSYFDRGHNCPSGDRTSSTAANSSTFLMTNMIPQAPNFNQGPWEGMETYIRNTLVGTSKEAWVIMGNYGTGGVNKSGTYVTTIDGGRVTVPSRVWKVVVVIPKGNSDLSRVDTSAIVLAVNMPNDNTKYTTTSSGKSAWRNYVTTISALEQDAASEGVQLSLLSSVNATVRAYLKEKVYR